MNPSKEAMAAAKEIHWHRTDHSGRYLTTEELAEIIDRNLAPMRKELCDACTQAIGFIVVQKGGSKTDTFRLLMEVVSKYDKTP